MHVQLPVIGIIHSCFKEKFGIPRQPGLAPLATAQLEFFPPYNDPAALDGLESCSHIWIQFIFHANSRAEWKPKVKPPRLGGNKSMGVFATRSPMRPAPLGLSVVKRGAIQQVDGKLILHLAGVDFLDGTPVLDVKPYVPYADKIDAAVNTFAMDAPPFVVVDLSEQQEFCATYQQKTGIELAELIRQVLQQDPRPQYQTPAPEKNYGMKLLNLDLRWRYQLTESVYHIVVIDIIVLAELN